MSNSIDEGKPGKGGSNAGSNNRIGFNYGGNAISDSNSILEDDLPTGYFDTGNYTLKPDTSNEIDKSFVSKHLSSERNHPRVHWRSNRPNAYSREYSADEYIKFNADKPKSEFLSRDYSDEHSYRPSDEYRNKDLGPIHPEDLYKYHQDGGSSKDEYYNLINKYGKEGDDGFDYHHVKTFRYLSPDGSKIRRIDAPILCDCSFNGNRDRYDPGYLKDSSSTTAIPFSTSPYPTDDCPGCGNYKIEVDNEYQNLLKYKHMRSGSADINHKRETIENSEEKESKVVPINADAEPKSNIVSMKTDVIQAKDVVIVPRLNKLPSSE
ncbi:hypothetical protein RF11_11508 [Thelohanellus kitauei]|uniref:Uncharacterized protein n=1 Tax=Thelohanellus kitauei TaxID=669202 RepID=A0A0C2NBP7_THEKT|nr:hypothetical protein RF11_11508 [Thelohanellus kitauei]